MSLLPMLRFIITNMIKMLTGYRFFFFIIMIILRHFHLYRDEEVCMLYYDILLLYVIIMLVLHFITVEVGVYIITNIKNMKKY